MRENLLLCEMGICMLEVQIFANDAHAAQRSRPGLIKAINLDRQKLPEAALFAGLPARTLLYTWPMLGKLRTLAQATLM